MKKSLVLAMAMALGVTASAYAANPFSDVPAGHWAYDSISKLAAAGVIEGYGDDTFRGDRLMTRYEMAQIVAKAMSKGANVNKLAAEFADELDALGVRVAALEKNSDNVRITGQIRYQWDLHTRQRGEVDPRGRTSRLRSRLWFAGKINDTWTYRGRLENRQNFVDDANNGNWLRLNKAYLDGRLGGTFIEAGSGTNLYIADGNVFDDGLDGIILKYGKKVRLGGFYGKAVGCNGLNAWVPAIKKSYGVSLGADLGKKASLTAEFSKFEPRANGDDLTIFDANLYGKLTDKVGLGVVYMHTDSDNAGFIPNGAPENGFVATLDIAGASFGKPNSWGIQAKYYHAPAGSAISHTMNANSAGNFFERGYKGYSIGASYTVAKNMMANVTWFDLKERFDDGAGNPKREKTLWTQLDMRF
ncbi:MAG: S-layer homology domain-containing protein [Acidaminococcaceae bacterium]|nr:S-layer homology domain-containing protein [Acidaminococcaceae bacterium]